MLPQQPNRSLIDGIECLQTLAGLGRAVGVTELARITGLEKTRVHRIVRTFAELGLTQQGPGRKYTVGPGIHVLSALAMFASGLLRRAFGPLAELGALGHTVALGVLWRDQVTYLYHSTPETPPGEALGRVGLFPASQSSIGRVLLAAKDEAAVRALYAGQAIEGYPQGVSALIGDLRKIRKQGFATAPTRDGITVAVPVGQASAQAAIALAGRIDKRSLPKRVRALRGAAEQIAEGGDSPSDGGGALDDTPYEG